MKKLALLLVVATATLSGCATQNTTGNQQSIINPSVAINTGMIFGKTMFQTAVTNKCQSELAANKVWGTAKKILSPAQQSQIPANICNCVGSESANSVTIDQLTVAAIDKNSRKTLVANSVANTLTSCYGKFMKR